MNKSKRKYPITRNRVVDAVMRSTATLYNPGFCVACGYEQDGCEPDMRKGKCEECGALKVYGAEELLIMATV